MPGPFLVQQPESVRDLTVGQRSRCKMPGHWRSLCREALLSQCRLPIWLARQQRCLVPARCPGKLCFGSGNRVTLSRMSEKGMSGAIMSDFTADSRISAAAMKSDIWLSDGDKRGGG